MNGVWVLGAVIGVAVVVLLWGIGVYNGLIKSKNVMQEAWSGIDVQLKRRHDLIPNLVSTAQGYMTHERDVLENVARLRSQSLGTTSVAAKGAAENQLTAGLRQLFAVAEAYPDLKANTNFLDLQQQLAGIEDNLQMARRYYNGAVRDYNIRVSSFPGVLVAGQLGFEAAEFFAADDADKAVPKVDFGNHA